MTALDLYCEIFRARGYSEAKIEASLKNCAYRTGIPRCAMNVELTPEKEADMRAFLTKAATTWDTNPASREILKKAVNQTIGKIAKAN